MIAKPKATLKVRISMAQKEALEKLAGEADVSVGQLIRRAVKKLLAEESARAGEANGAEARDTHTSSDPGLAQCRRAVVKALSLSKDWKTMQRKLGSKGYEYQAYGGGLAIFETKEGDYVCKASDVGPGYSALIKHFRAPFPGHPHKRLADRILQRIITI
jgi:hypothetical protein